MSHKSSVPLYWRLQRAKYNLVGTQCITCKSLYFPPRSICPKCRSKGFTRQYKFKPRGFIETFTVIRTAPEGFEKMIPYAIAIIKLEEGPKVSGLMTDAPETLEIGKEVNATFRKIYEDGKDGIIHYGLKWTMKE